MHGRDVRRGIGLRRVGTRHFRGRNLERRGVCRAVVDMAASVTQVCRGTAVISELEHRIRARTRQSGQQRQQAGAGAQHGASLTSADPGAICRGGKATGDQETSWPRSIDHGHAPEQQLDAGGGFGLDLLAAGFAEADARGGPGARVDVVVMVNSQPSAWPRIWLSVAMNRWPSS